MVFRRSVKMSIGIENSLLTLRFSTEGGQTHIPEPPKLVPLPHSHEMTGNPELQKLVLFTPHCECEICCEQIRPIEHQHFEWGAYVGPDLTNDQVVACTQNYVESILADQQYLRDKIESQGHSLLKKWRKSSGKRKEFLERSGVFENPLPLLWLTVHCSKYKEIWEHRTACLLPYLNAGTLALDPTNLIWLLHHRVFSNIAEWVPFDHSELNNSWRVNLFKEVGAHGCIILHGPQYGQWKPFDADAVHSGAAYCAPRGLAILEAQCELFRSLRALTDRIVPNRGTEAALEKAQATSQNSQTSLNLSRKWTRCVVEDTNLLSKLSVYGTPFTGGAFEPAPHCNLESLNEVASIYASEAQDELWLLQTDIAYFHERLSYYESCWYDTVGDLAGASHEIRKTKYDNIAYLLTIKPAQRAQIWQWIAAQTNTALVIREECGDAINIGKPLPQVLHRALWRLGSLLEKTLEGRQDDLHRLIMRSPAFSSQFQLERLDSTLPQPSSYSSRPRSLQDLYREDILAWCLYFLTLKPRSDRQAFPLSVIFERLDGHLILQQSERARIDTEIDRCLSDMIILQSMLDNIELHRPQIGIFGRKSQFSRMSSSGHWDWLLKNIEVPLLASTLALGKYITPPTKFQPPRGRKNIDWLTRRDQAHASLNAVWIKASLAYRRILEHTCAPQDEIPTLLEPLAQSTSREQQRRLDEERDTILRRLRVGKEAAQQELAFSQFIPLSPFNTQQPKVSPQPRQNKIKTRPETITSQEIDLAKPLVDLKLTQTRPIEVCYKLKSSSSDWPVIASLFPQPKESVTNTENPTKWADFVRTLSTLGLNPKPRGGSSFVFSGNIRQPGLDGEQKHSINFHRPHPSAEMSAVMMQTWGNRLKRRFGWGRESFGVKDNGATGG